MKLTPPGALQLEDLWKGRPLCLNDLAQPGSATTFGWLEIGRAMRVICFLEHQARIFHIRAHSGTGTLLGARKCNLHSDKDQVHLAGRSVFSQGICKDLKSMRQSEYSG